MNISEQGDARRPLFRRYVAIGDSSTEGLEDPDGFGGHRGWADRLAEQVANSQEQPLEYANLAIRGLWLPEIYATQFEHAMALQPDLLSVFGGVNDILGAVRINLESMHDHYAAMFSEARAKGITVLTFTAPDPTGLQFGWALRDRILILNDVIRTEAERYGVLLVDFEKYPVAGDRRLWFEDRLHSNSYGHSLIARALAWRLGLVGADLSWTEPMPRNHKTSVSIREQLSGDARWAVRYFAPWLNKAVRRTPHGFNRVPKRPVPQVVNRTSADGQQPLTQLKSA